ncbi:MAG: hypothetical protein V4613_03925 [Bacteroidota bacterium]
MKTLLLFAAALMLSPLGAQDLGNIQNEKPVALSGGLNIQTGFYAMNGAKARQPGFTYIVSGSPVISIYGLSLPFSFTFSNYQRDFRQPFNQFGVSPVYKWITVHAGYRNISYSQFGMAGFTVLGGGIELKPKKFRFAVLYGRSQKAVKDDTSKSIETNLNDITYPTYKRMLFASKIGYGSNNNFIDLHFLSGKDDSSSLPFRPITSQVMPAKNQVFSTSAKLSFFKKKLIWQGEGGLSVYTRDIAFEEVDLENKLANSVLKANITSQIYGAYETQLNYTEKKFGVGAKYRRVAPDYKSMGAYYFQTDFEQYLGNFKANVMANKLRFSGSAGIQKDNLLKKKIATTKRSIYNGVISFVPSAKFGIDVSVANYGTSQRAGRRNLSDTAVINQINNSITITPRYIIVKANIVNTWQLLAGRQSLDDKNRNTEKYTQVNMQFANLIFVRSNTKTTFSYNSGLNYNLSQSIAGKIGLAGIIAGCSKGWKNGKFTADANFSFNMSTYNQEYNGITSNLMCGAGYKIAKKHKVSLSASGLLNRSKAIEAGSSFEEYFLKINYGFTL